MTAVSIRPGKGQKFAACICEYNIDITAGGCAVAQNLETGEYDRKAACSYCYASYLHRNYVKPKTVKERAWAKTTGDMRVNVIRIGKNTEPGAPEHREQLLQVLQYNNKYGCKSILITKLLEYDDEVATLLKYNDSALHFSLGNSQLEYGVVEYRKATNLIRSARAAAYAEAKVNVWLRPTEDIVRPMREEVKQCLDTYPHLKVLVTPLRYRAKALFPQWDEVITGNLPGYYYDKEERAIAPRLVHADWRKYMHNGCGKVDNKLLCNACGLRGITAKDKKRIT